MTSTTGILLTLHLLAAEVVDVDAPADGDPTATALDDTPASAPGVAMDADAVLALLQTSFAAVERGDPREALENARAARASGLLGKSDLASTWWVEAWAHAFVGSGQQAQAAAGIALRIDDRMEFATNDPAFQSVVEAARVARPAEAVLMVTVRGVADDTVEVQVVGDDLGLAETLEQDGVRQALVQGRALVRSGGVVLILDADGNVLRDVPPRATTTASPPWLSYAGFGLAGAGIVIMTTSGISYAIAGRQMDPEPIVTAAFVVGLGVGTAALVAGAALVAFDQGTLFEPESDDPPVHAARSASLASGSRIEKSR